MGGQLSGGQLSGVNCRGTCVPCVTVSTYPSMYNFGLEVSPLKCDLGRQASLCNTSSEAGALPSEVLIENDSNIFFGLKIFEVKNFKLFWKLLLCMFHATLIIMSRKYFLGFRSPQLPLDIRFWTQGFSLEIRSRKAGLPFATRSRKRELCFQSYASIILITRTENRKSKIFKLFLETTFVHVSCYPNHYEQKIFFRFSKSGLEGSP